MAKVGEMTFENLIYDTEFPMIKKAVKLDSTATAMKRGTALQNDGGKVVALTAAGSGTGTAPFAILADDTEGGEKWVTVYLTGRFIRDTVNTVTGITLTDTQAEAFRKLGIYLEYAKK